MKLNFDKYRPRGEPLEPTKKQVALYRGWRKYLKDSRLDSDEQHERAAYNASINKKVPTD